MHTNDLGRYSSRCRYTRYSYQADYSAVIAPDGRALWYRLPNSNWIRAAITRLGSVRIAKAIVQPLAQPPRASVYRAMRRALREHLPAWCDIYLLPRQYSEHRTRLLARDTRNGELFHVERDTCLRDASQLAATIESALQRRFTERRLTERNAELDRALEERGWLIEVTTNDSVLAGNCPLGTQSFRERELIARGIEDDSIPAAALLRIRDDSFTRRAARAAALRHTIPAASEPEETHDQSSL